MTEEQRDAFYARGWALREAGRSDLAAREFERAIEADPRSARSFAMLSLCRSAMGEHSLAVEAARTALSLDPTDPFVVRTMGWALIWASQPAQARTHAMEALRLDPHEPYGFILLAEIELLCARHPETLEAADRALAADPREASAHRQRSAALRHLGRMEESRSAAESALALKPNECSSHLMLGRIAAAQRDGTAAARAYREALRLNPSNQEAREGLLVAMKVRNRAYRWATGFHDWFYRLPWPARLAILFLVAVVTMGVGLWVILLVLFAGRSVDPVANVVLRFDRYGRQLLSREQIASADFLLRVVLGIGFVVVAAVCGAGVRTVIDALLVGLLLPTVAAAWNCQPGRPTERMVVYVVLIAAFVVTGNLLWITGYTNLTLIAYLVAAVGIAAGEGMARRCGYPWSHRFDSHSR